MKISNLKPIGLAVATMSMMFLASCTKESSMIPGNEIPDVERKAGTTYVLNSVAVPSIYGEVKFEKVGVNTKITIELQGTPEGGVHPAHIHMNSAVEGGGIALSLKPVDGGSGKSVTVVRNLDDGTPVSYEDLINFDGYINVHLSASNLGTIVAQGDIGGNAFTGQMKTYSLNDVAVPGIMGNAKFMERKNGNTLVRLQLMNTPAGGIHPAHIHMNSAAVGGGIAVSLNSVNGDNGISMTNVRMLDNLTSIDYAGLLNFNGYINVHLSAAQLNVIVAQGDIGSNNP